MDAATDALGMMASLTSFLIWLPQGARVWRYRNDAAQLQGIVLTTQVIALAGTVLWGAYAILIGSFWLGAPSIVNGPIAIATLVVVGRANRSAARVPDPRQAVGPRTSATGIRAADVRDLVAA